MLCKTGQTVFRSEVIDKKRIEKYINRQKKTNINRQKNKQKFFLQFKGQKNSQRSFDTKGNLKKLKPYSCQN